MRSGATGVLLDVVPASDDATRSGTGADVATGAAGFADAALTRSGTGGVLTGTSLTRAARSAQRDACAARRSMTASAAQSSAVVPR